MPQLPPDRRSRLRYGHLGLRANLWVMTQAERVQRRPQSPRSSADPDVRSAAATVSYVSYRYDWVPRG